MIEQVRDRNARLREERRKAVIKNACVKMQVTRVHVEVGSTTIFDVRVCVQSIIRMFLCRRVYKATIRKVCKIQAVWAGHKTRQLAKRRRAAAKRIGRNWKTVSDATLSVDGMCCMAHTALNVVVVCLICDHQSSYDIPLSLSLSLCVTHTPSLITHTRVQWAHRRRFLRLQRQIIRLQSWWRGARERQHFRFCRIAANRIKRALTSLLRNKALTSWVQELHAACSWGDVGVCLPPSSCVCVSLPLFVCVSPCPVCVNVCSRAWLGL